MSEDNLLLGTDRAGEFLRDMREAMSGGRRPIPQTILSIATDPTLRTRLAELVEAGAIEPFFRDALVDFVEDTAESLEEEVDRHDALIELIDRACLPVAVAAVLSGIGLLISTGFGRASLGLLLGGLLSLTAASGGRTLLRLKANTRKSSAKKLRRLGTRLKEL